GCGGGVEGKGEGGGEVGGGVMERGAEGVGWWVVREDGGVGVGWGGVGGDGALRMGDYDAMITKRTKVVTVTQCSNVLGTINPVQEIARRAHEVGAICVVDAAQSVPHMPVDVQKIGCDFLAFSGHKMLAPTGMG